MELVGLNVSPEEVKAKLAEYEAADANDPRYASIARVYKALDEGRKVITMPETIVRGGFLSDGLPRLAIARRTARETKVTYGHFGSLKYTYKYNSTDKTMTFKNGTAPPGYTDNRTATTRVPLTPPGLIPKDVSEDSLYVLFEAEWKVIELPRDPALLRALGGDYYEVLATWDLTEVEARGIG
jgi:hypothetical protein